MSTPGDRRTRLALATEALADVEAEIARASARVDAARGEVLQREKALAALAKLGAPGKSPVLMVGMAVPLFNMGNSFARASGTGGAIFLGLASASTLLVFFMAVWQWRRENRVVPGIARARVSPELAVEEQETRGHEKAQERRS